MSLFGSQSKPPDGGGVILQFMHDTQHVLSLNMPLLCGLSQPQNCCL